MKRLRAYNKFYRRYEVDLWGRAGYQRTNKTVRFLQKIQREKIKFSINPGRTFLVHPYKNKILKEADDQKEKEKDQPFASRIFVSQVIYSRLLKFKKRALVRNKKDQIKLLKNEKKKSRFFKLSLLSRLKLLTTITKLARFARYFRTRKTNLLKLCTKLREKNLDSKQKEGIRKAVFSLIVARVLLKKRKREKSAKVQKNKKIKEKDRNRRDSTNDVSVNNTPIKSISQPINFVEKHTLRENKFRQPGAKQKKDTLNTFHLGTNSENFIL